MAGKKPRFTSFLEFANGALPDAFSSQVLGSVPNEREDEEHDPDKLLRKKLQTMMGTTQENPDEQPDDNDARLFKILKGFLTHDEGDGGAGDEGPHDDSPSGVDHDETKDVGPYPLNDDPTDQPHDGEVADDNYEDEKHSQLLAAISDLRNELRSMKSGESQPQSGSRGRVFRIPDEENEEHWLHGKAPRKGTVAHTIWKQKVDQDKKPSSFKIKDDMVGTARRLPHSEENEESYEEDEQEDTKQGRARQMFMALVNQGMSRQDIIDQFMKNIGVTNSTATSYYQRLAKEAGLTTSGNREMPGQGEPPGLGIASGIDPSTLHGGQSGGPQAGMEMPQEPESNIDGFEVQGDPNKQGLIRTVKGAHLVYKRKNEEGTYDELWVFGTGENDIKDSLEVRRAILAGTDIPPRALKSENGSQSYTLTSLGNGQLLKISGLPN